jgi:hypothetical protein
MAPTGRHRPLGRTRPPRRATVTNQQPPPSIHAGWWVDCTADSPHTLYLVCTHPVGGFPVMPTAADTDDQGARQAGDRSADPSPSPEWTGATSRPLTHPRPEHQDSRG